MTGWLLDTNIVSELRKPRPEARVVGFVAKQALHSLFVSEITFAEIRFGIEQLADHARRAGLNDWLTNELRPMFEGRVLAVTEDVILQWRLVVELGRKSGHTFSQPDLFIAATALHYGLTAVTRDADDYRVAGAAVFNPWTDPEPDAASSVRAPRR